MFVLGKGQGINCMKVVDAYWEKINFGYDVVEIVLNRKDLDAVDGVVRELESNYLDKYVVLKMPVADLNALHCFEKLNFNYMETSFGIFKNIKDNDCVEILKGVENPLSVKELETESELLEVLENIENDMFLTDRVYLDSALDKSVAKSRYINWVKQEYSQHEKSHVKFFIKKTTGEKVGFSLGMYDRKRRILYSVLGGIYRKYQDMGYSPFSFQAGEQDALRIGVKKIKTSISSNNVGIFKIYSLFGYQVHSIQYTLRRLKQI